MFAKHIHIKLIFAVLLIVLCIQCETVEKQDKPQLISYPIPFYERYEGCTKTHYWGIQTKYFKLIENENGTWLLYDKRVDDTQQNNLANFDEYTFIQLDLQKQLQELLKNTNNRYILGGINYKEYRPGKSQAIRYNREP